MVFPASHFSMSLQALLSLVLGRWVCPFLRLSCGSFRGAGPSGCPASSFIWSGWWGCYTGEVWSWSCSQGTAALVQSTHQGQVMNRAPPHIQLAPPVALVVKNPSAIAEDIRAAGSIPGSGRSLAGGNGSPLQHSCSENPKDRGAWWTTVQRVTRRRTRLSGLAYTHPVMLSHCSR